MGTAERISDEQTEHDFTDDESYYGYRTVIGYDENGKSVVSGYRPLTFDDLLEPEEGDVYMQGELHVNDVIRLKSIFRHHLEKQGNIKVYCDMKIIWGIEGLKNPAPDISLVRDVKNPGKPRSVFNVPEEGTKPFFVLEVVSPRYRNADINKKPEIYRKAGVSEYIIADPGLENGIISYTVSGCRMMGGRYFRMKPDRLGRITSVTAGIMIGPADSGTRLAVYDAMTGQEILSDEARAEYAENLAEQEKARAEQEKIRAEYAENLVQQEKARAETAEKELIRLKAKMKASGISEE